MKKGPSHIAIILDGNRRYAKKNSLNPGEGHRKGAEKIENILDWCYDLGVMELTLYCFSMQNFERPKKEVKILLDLFRSQIRKLEKDKRVDGYGINIKFIGRLELFPGSLQDDMERVMKNTCKNDKFKLNLAMGYGGREEIVDAVNRIIGKRAKKVNQKSIKKNLYLADEPELVIRTGGDYRVSNFLIWQSYYSEWYFTKKLWPEFSKADLKKAIQEYRSRSRRFGR